jgi:CBS domain containing-hemolysin-like protein
MPSNPNRKAAIGVLAALSVAIVLYSLLIVQQILLGLIVAVVPWFLYLLVRFVLTLERIATALERLAAVRDRESYERDTETDGGVEDE